MIVSRNKLVKWFIFILCLLGVVWAANPFSLYFANDDFYHIPLSGKHVFGQSNLLRPVSEITLWIDYTFWEKNPAGYHLTNLLLHILNTGLLYVFVKKLLYRTTRFSSERIKETAWIVAVLFLVYPSHMEAIFWILGRGASLAMFFTLISLIFFLKAVEKRVYYFLSLFFFVIAMLTYETSFITPLLVSVIAVIINRKEKGRPLSGQVAIFWILLIGYWVLRVSLTGIFLGDHEAGSLIKGNLYLLFYNFNELMARSLLPPMSSGKIFLSCYVIMILVIAISFFLIKKKNKESLVVYIMCWVLFLITLLPVLSPGIDTHDTEASRFLYLPAVFFITVFVIAVFSLATKPALKKVIFLITGIYFLGSFILFSQHYKVSAVIAGTTIKALEKEHGYRNIYAVGLPSQFRGATIFRKSFDKALNWMCPELTFQSLKIIDPREIEMPASTYKINELSFNEWETENAGRLQLINDSSSGTVMLQGKYYFEPGKDLLLIWSDSTITKINH